MAPWAMLSWPRVPVSAPDVPVVRFGADHQGADVAVRPEQRVEQVERQRDRGDHGAADHTEGHQAGLCRDMACNWVTGTTPRRSRRGQDQLEGRSC